MLFSVRPDAEAYGRRLRVIFRVLGESGRMRILTATAPERWDFLGLGPRTRDRLERGLVAFNSTTREVAAEFGVPCLEVANHPGLAESANFVADGLHPSRSDMNMPQPGSSGCSIPIGKDPDDHRPTGARFRPAAARRHDHHRGRTITEADLVSFAALTGDWHPQHADADWAARSPFGERIAHGMLVLSYAIGLLPIDPERVTALRGLRSVVFKRPAPIGTTIHAEAEIAGLRELDPGHGLVELGLRVRDAEGSLLIRATIDALWKREGLAPPAGTAAPVMDAEVELAP